MSYKYNKTLALCLVLVSVCFFSFCKKSAGNSSTTPPVITPPVVTDTSTYQLVWSDEFDGSTISTANWNFETGNNNGWGNNEKEYYQQQNADIENGNLVITAKKENRWFEQLYICTHDYAKQKRIYLWQNRSTY